MGKFLLYAVAWIFVIGFVVSLNDKLRRTPTEELLSNYTLSKYGEPKPARNHRSTNRSHQNTNYNQEIITNVINPCYREIARTGGLTEYMSEEESIKAIKSLTQKEAEDTIRSISKAVQGQSTTDRMKVYKKGASMCVAAAARR